LNLTDSKGKWKQWTVILGDNGTGKTTLLQLLAAFQMTDDQLNNEYGYSPAGMPQKDFSLAPGREAATLVTARFNFTGPVGEDDAVLLMRGFVQMGMSWHSEKAYRHIQCFGYGASRMIGQSSLSENIPSNAASLFDEYIPLVNAEEWLLQLDYSANSPSAVQAFAIAQRNKVKQILIALLPDVEDIRFIAPTHEKLVPGVEFLTHLGWVTLHQLSLGYKCMVAWLADFAFRMFERYPDSPHPLEEPAIVLIDEIDLHLHPRWQRNIFDFLGKTFPATQFIVTAHSPLIVQSAPQNGNLVLLRKQGSEVVIDQNTDNVRNWRIDQILSSELFELPARNQEVEEKLERRRALIGQAQLSPAEQQELDALNAFAETLPYAESELDIRARNIVREAAAMLQKRQAKKDE
jgi:energy-coupling factor transporter ATP-binding protein EcfA2